MGAGPGVGGGVGEGPGPGLGAGGGPGAGPGPGEGLLVTVIRRSLWALMSGSSMVPSGRQARVVLPLLRRAAAPVPSTYPSWVADPSTVLTVPERCCSVWQAQRQLLRSLTVLQTSVQASTPHSCTQTQLPGSSAAASSSVFRINSASVYAYTEEHAHCAAAC